MIKARKGNKVLMVQLEYRDLEVILVHVVMWEMMVIKAKKANKAEKVNKVEKDEEQKKA